MNKKTNDKQTETFESIREEIEALTNAVRELIIPICEISSSLHEISQKMD
ncbi:hypothetical protein [Heminiphilus faecis]|nr:hypothetical protein [Heminiphilus faecis]